MPLNRHGNVERTWRVLAVHYSFDVRERERRREEGDDPAEREEEATVAQARLRRRRARSPVLASTKHGISSLPVVPTNVLLCKKEY